MATTRERNWEVIGIKNDMITGGRKRRKGEDSISGETMGQM